MDTDWAEDDTMSAEETLARFEALNPEPALGPHVTPRFTVTSSTLKVQVTHNFSAARGWSVRRPMLEPTYVSAAKVPATH